MHFKWSDSYERHLLISLQTYTYKLPASSFPLFVVIKWTTCCRLSSTHILVSLFFLLLIVVLEEMQKGHHNHRNEVSLLLRRNACVPRWLSVRELKMLFSWFSTSNGSCGMCENWYISSIMPAIKTLFELQTSFEETCQVLSSYVSCWTSTSARMQEKDQKYFLCLQTWTDQT